MMPQGFYSTAFGNVDVWPPPYVEPTMRDSRAPRLGN
jgi:hypothetical protein